MSKRREPTAAFGKIGALGVEQPFREESSKFPKTTVQKEGDVEVDAMLFFLEIGKYGQSYRVLPGGKSSEGRNLHA